ncbi:hypothetical protein SETIT_2G441100v2 [Setaria italica]|uniref:Uncharacterized protein n=1 Tax=Setaria italica TaxID=4555 RepID=A0A368Q9H9_SETIT|nr:hypothetical protein SETIT_2G441100v2 [Setaria italica]
MQRTHTGCFGRGRIFIHFLKNHTECLGSGNASRRCSQVAMASALEAELCDAEQPVSMSSVTSPPPVLRGSRMQNSASPMPASVMKLCLRTPSSGSATKSPSALTSSQSGRGGRERDDVAGAHVAGHRAWRRSGPGLGRAAANRRYLLCLISDDQEVE